MKKKLIPPMPTDKAAATFIEDADLSGYDLSTFRPANFEFASKSERVTMRIPAGLLAQVKQLAHEQNMPYQRYMRQLLSEALSARRP